MTESIEKKVFSYREAALILGVSQNTLRVWMSQGRIKHFVRLGSRVGFTEKHLNLIIEEGIE